MEFTMKSKLIFKFLDDPEGTPRSRLQENYTLVKSVQMQAGGNDKFVLLIGLFSDLYKNLNRN